MLTYRFASGWGCRELTRKELFNIWGLSELEDTEVLSDWLVTVAPSQIANLLLSAYFSKDKAVGVKLKNLSRSTPVSSPSQTTIFTAINRSISHDWIDDNIVFSPIQKANNAPVPALLWDKRIIASFPNKAIDLELLRLF